MKSEIKHHAKNIIEAAEHIQKLHDQSDVLVNMRYEKLVGSGVIHKREIQTHQQRHLQCLPQ